MTDLIVVVGIACSGVSLILVGECLRLVRRARGYAREAEQSARLARRAAAHHAVRRALRESPPVRERVHA